MDQHITDSKGFFVCTFITIWWIFFILWLFFSFPFGCLLFCFLGLGGIVVLDFYLPFEKELKGEWIKMGKDLEELGGREVYDQNILKLKNYFKQ